MVIPKRITAEMEGSFCVFSLVCALIARGKFTDGGPS